MTLTLRYFAWLRERVGEPPRPSRPAPPPWPSSSTSSAPARTATRSPSPTCAAVRVAVDQELADFAAPIGGAREVAFFPPMTGG